MSEKFLNSDRVSELWNKAKEYVDNTIGGNSGGIDFTTDETLSMSEENVLGVTTPIQGIKTQAEFDALPEEQQNKGLYVISDGESSGGGASAGEIYSTEEVRIGTWIDGKPIYRKVIPINSEIEAEFLIPVADVSALKIDTLITMEGWCHLTSHGSYRSLNSLNAVLSLNGSKTEISAWFSTDYPEIMYLIIEYTRTTDEAVTT